ncbi:MAG: hypothetical protein ACI9BD_001177 [Candidatus Marinamargulisbacteria bacterium]
MLCLWYPDVVPFIGKTTPTIEIYDVAGSGLVQNQAGGRIVLMFDADDNVIGGITRRFFSETSQGLAINFDTPLRSASKNGDGTYTLANYGSSASSSDLEISAFQRVSHTGSMVGASVNATGYEAFKN